MTEKIWLTGPELCLALGIVRVASKTVDRYERKGSPRNYLYRIVPSKEIYSRHAARGVDARECAGCARALTRNRTHRISGVSLCGTCAKRVTIGGDVAFAKSLRI